MVSLHGTVDLGEGSQSILIWKEQSTVSECSAVFVMWFTKHRMKQEIK